ncbi:MAG: DAK2 domain-containing protein [Eubacterium sp.]|nr:DAK2 domain-containing protein [Eubacterium sp.]
MSENKITAEMIYRMFISGARNLEKNRAWIDELNVFPVPDGDTGTNMTMTIMSAMKELATVTSDKMYDVCQAISHGSLRGARGNSGVILSQLLRGFTRSIRDFESVGIMEISAAVEKAVETAYKAVMKPKEGTILTVARAMGRKSAEIAEPELAFGDYLKAVIDEGDRILLKTPEMLPVLKEAGVVDSGGQGLMVVMHGVYDAYLEKDTEFNPAAFSETAEEPVQEETSKSAMRQVKENADIRFGYCTEFIINIPEPASEDRLSSMLEFLNSIGDSIVFVPDDDLIKVHVHTNNPGEVLTRALTFGELSKVKIDNMREEHREVLGLTAEEAKADMAKTLKELNAPAAASEEKTPVELKKYGFISVCSGEGFREVFENLGVDEIIYGGQTMNPSTSDFIDAAAKVDAENIFIFPNNSNIIMAANQAASMTEDKNLIVIPAKTMPQGITAVASFDESLSPEDNEENMKAMISTVSTASITYAIRDTTIDSHEIHENDIMSVGDSGILAVGSDLKSVAVESVKAMATDETGVITIYYGEDTSQEDAEAIAAEIEEEYDYCDVEVLPGGQAVYYCIISVE